MPQIDLPPHDPNDYDPTSFASIMRRCFANVLHGYPVTEGENGEELFQKVHRRIVPLRARLTDVYQRQFRRGTGAEIVALEQIGIAALNELNAGRTPEDVTRLSRTKLLALARAAQKVETAHE